MKILMVTATYPPSTNGVAIAVQNLKDSLIKIGHKVLVLAPENSEVEKETGVVRYPSIQNPVIKDYPIPLFPRTKKIQKIIKEFGPDVVHVHHPMHIGYFAKQIADNYQIPLIFTFHTRYDLYAEKYAKYLPKGLRKYLLENTIYKFCQKVDLVISPSLYLHKELYKRYPFWNMETMTAPVSVSDVGAKSKSDIRKKLGIDKNKRILFTVARLGREKNLEVLIRSIQNLPDIFLLLIAGTGPDEKKLKKLVASLSLGKKVKFLGKVDHKDISSYYSLSDAFCFPSVTETQGLIFLEAITCGLPIVAINSAAAREWVKKDFGVLVDNSPTGLSEGIISLFKNNVQKMGSEAKKYSANFTSVNLAKKSILVYKKVVERKKLAYKITETGWQSWSPSKKRIIKYPLWSYKPNKDFYLPNLPKPIKHKRPIFGWCSWYKYGKNINAEVILTQAQWFKRNKDIPIKYILVDEGWTERGDWDKSDVEKFPKGIGRLRQEINNLGFKAGIWMSPFLVSPKSYFFERNNDLLVKIGGIPVSGVKSFPIYDRLNPCYMLDVRKKRARKFVYKQIDILLNGNQFDLIKLDFLYSIFFIPGISEKEAGYYLRKLLIYIRNKYPEVYTIACGAPFAPLIGAVDSVRVGPDITIPYISELRLIGRALNTYKFNLVKDCVEKRSWTRKYWNLDPDVFSCDANLKYSSTQLDKLQKLILESGGNIFLGDEMTKLSEERINKFIKPLFTKL